MKIAMTQAGVAGAVHTGAFLPAVAADGRSVPERNQQVGRQTDALQPR